MGTTSRAVSDPFCIERDLRREPRGTPNQPTSRAPSFTPSARAIATSVASVGFEPRSGGRSRCCTCFTSNRARSATCSCVNCAR